MAKISVYYDYYEGEFLPKWKVINLKDNNIDWSKNFVYIPVEAPFQKKSIEDFQSDEMSVTVEMKDLTLNVYQPNAYGINLPNIAARLKEHNIDPDEVKNFILLVGDIEEVMQVNIVGGNSLE